MSSSSFYSTSEDSTTVSVFRVLYYGSVTVLIIFLILVFVHFTVFPIFALTPNDPGIIVVSGASDRELSYKNGATPAVQRNKDIPRTTLPDICNYTIGFDVKLDRSTQTNSQSYPIVILYRGSTPVTSYASAKNTRLGEPTKLSEVYQNTNIIVWAEGDTKDIHVTLVTLTGEKSMNVVIRPSSTDRSAVWFRITIVVADSFAEVYMNAALKATINVPEGLKQINDTDFFPPVVPPEVGGITIANMAMWPRLLTSKEIRLFEATPMSSV
jgi:hypothetical protein